MSGPVPAVGWLARLYGWALRLYPLGVRREYAAEMQAVFRLKAGDAARRGAFPLLGLACREVRDLPGAIARAHWSARRGKMKTVMGDPVRETRLNACKVAAIFLPFALMLLFSMDQWIKGALFAVPGLLMLVLLVVTMFAGMAKILPLWALPSLGMLLSIIYLYFFKIAVQIVVVTSVMRPLFGGVPKDVNWGIAMLLLTGFGAALFTFAVALGVVWMIPKFKERVRQDWTVLSFLFYSMAILPMFFDDEFHNLEGYQIASLLLLAAGAGLYLLSSRRWQRALALVVPVLISQALMVLGRYQVYPLEAWIDLANPNQHIWEALQPLSDLIFLLLLLPALVTLIPNRRKPAPTPSSNTTLSTSS